MIVLSVGSIPTLRLKTFEQLFWTTTWRKNSRNAQWQTQSRYLCHCAFLVSFRYAGSEKTWSNHSISLSRTWDSPGVTPSVISLALRLNWTEIFFLFVVSLSPILYVIFWISYQLHAIEILMDINSFFTQIIYYFKTQLNFLSIQHFCGLYEYIKFFNFGLKNIDSDRRDTWHHWRSRRPFHTCSCCTVSLLDLLFICAASARKHS